MKPSDEFLQQIVKVAVEIASPTVENFCANLERLPTKLGQTELVALTDGITQPEARSALSILLTDWCDVSPSAGVTGSGRRQILSGELVRGPRSISGSFGLLLDQFLGEGISISVPRFGERSEPERGTEMARRLTSLCLRLPGRLALALARANTRFKF